MSLDRATVEQMKAKASRSPAGCRACASLELLAEDWLRQEEALKQAHLDLRRELYDRALETVDAALAARPQTEEEA